MSRSSKGSKTNKTNRTNKSNKTNSTKSKTPTMRNVTERMKYEIANELGVNLGPDASSRANGTVGGEITKKLVELGKSKIR